MYNLVLDTDFYTNFFQRKYLRIEHGSDIHEKETS